MPPMRHHLLPPPPDLQNPFGVGGLLRLPLPASMPPLGHGPVVPPAPLFARPEQHFRMEQLMSEQFRQHGLNLAAAAAAAVAANVPPHAAAAAFAPPPSDGRQPPPSAQQVTRTGGQPVVNLEPQLDFYSQRLRQLAGTTSPGGAAMANSPSPLKHSPPFASPTPSQPAASNTANSNINNSGSSNNSEHNAHSLSPPPKAGGDTSAGADTPAITTTPTSANTPPSKPGTPPSDAAAVHACEFCGKKFRFQSNLAVHKRTHSGERIYKCNVCEHSCTQSSKHKRHMKLHRTPEDRTSNAGSVETLDGEESEDDELEEEEEEESEEIEHEEEAEDLSVPPAKTTQPSLVGELMDKFGLSNIAQYSEAYKQALQESNSALNLQKDRDNNNSKSLPGAPPFAKGMLPVPPPQQPMPLFPHFADPFEATKRIKMELGREDWWQLGIKMEQKGGGPAGPSALLPGPLIKKESRRNDTCEYCGKVFKNCSNLTVHRRSHTGEKPYKCELCSYACAQSSKLTRHMKTHGRLGKDVYRCRFCEMPFSVPSTLEKHMRKCVVNQGKGHFLPPLPMLCGDEDSAPSPASKDAT